MKKVIKTSVITAVMIFIVACLSLMLICNSIVVNNAKGKIFSEIDSIGNNEVGLLLGTAPNTRIGNRQNYYFYYRIRATEELYKAGKIKKILIELTMLVLIQLQLNLRHTAIILFRQFNHSLCINKM